MRVEAAKPVLKRGVVGRWSVDLRAWAAAHELRAVVLLTGLVVLLFYGYSLAGGFAAYDDPILIVGNPGVHSLGASLHYLTTPVSFTSDLRGSGESFYRPFFWLSLATDASVWGLHAVAFHAMNLLLHWLNGVLLYFLLRRVEWERALALASAVVWLVLPVNAEAVAWISGRSYSLSTAFVLGGLLCGERYLRGRASAAALVGYAALGAGALLSHEQGMLLLPLTLLVAVGAGSGRLRERVLSVRARVLYGIAVALDGGYLLVAHAVGVRGGMHFGAVSSLGLTVAKYVGWLLLPVRMSVERSTDTPVAGWSVAAVVALLGVAGLTGALVFVRRVPRAVRVGVAWLVICLLPFAGLVVIYQGMAERYVYLASIGLAVVVCGLGAAVPERLRLDVIRLRLGVTRVRLGVVGVVAVWVMWGVVRLEMRLRDWHDPVRLYQSSLRATPRSFKLGYDLGALYEEQGQYPEALAAYRDSLRSNLGYEPSIAGMGNAYLLMNDPEMARQFYEQALVRKNDDVKTINNYGTSLDRLGRLNDAKRQYMRAIALAPADDTAYCDLATLFFDAGQPEVAEALFKRAIGVNTQDPLPYSNLGAIYAQQARQGRPEQKVQALAMYRKVLELDPADASAISAVASLQDAK